MGATRTPLLLVMADGVEHLVHVDQRDHAAAEAMDMPVTSPNRVTRMRFLGWSAARREGLVKAPWEKFNATDCVDCNVPDDYAGSEVDHGSADDLDPGRPGQSDAG